MKNSLGSILNNLFITDKGNRGVRVWHANTTLGKRESDVHPSEEMPLLIDRPVHMELGLPKLKQTRYEMVFVAPKDSDYQFVVRGSNGSSLRGARMTDYEVRSH
ncbi:hypothetical protein FBUS_03262 [Fasciolopsis buskii]|uniref:Uncharacterized protein n=1 Tax=Fasciolopsis buskii TaxID=27845 RepID=A0A8E0RLM4_9TREM|nr:hypothetical protein FBUS_03262 [Fasciolopsis buski]